MSRVEIAKPHFLEPIDTNRVGNLSEISPATALDPTTQPDTRGRAVLRTLFNQLRTGTVRASTRDCVGHETAHRVKHSARFYLARPRFGDTFVPRSWSGPGNHADARLSKMNEANAGETLDERTRDYCHRLLRPHHGCKDRDSSWLATLSSVLAITPITCI